jgi:serine carboxypeptidase-like clade 1
MMTGLPSPLLLSLLVFPFAIPRAASVLVDVHQDRVKSLPGYDAPLPSRWYSGFLDYELEGQQIHTHYIMVEAERESVSITPTPLIYWSNGGPGASSMFGLLTELGPLILSDDSVKTDAYRDTGLPTLFYNSRSWTRLGHILVFDAPAPVGYSYCNSDEQPDHDHNSTNHKKECISWTDELASQNAYLALKTFFQDKFPVLQQTPLYLTGESYAGIYIPTLARRIVENQDDFAINLKGFAVGDGCLGTETGICGSLSSDSRFDYWLVLFLAGHGQIPLSTFAHILQVCKSTTTATTDHHHHESSRRLGISASNIAIDKDACQEALDTLEAQVGGYYEYALYDECGARNGLMSSSFLSGAENDYPCGGGVVMEDYVALPQVKEALHVDNGTFFSVDNANNFDYTPTEKDISGFYKSQVGKLKMLVYNGDTDPAITSFAAQNWTSNLGLDVKEDWRPWTLDGCKRVGGYVTRYKGGLDFLTIRGAGHLVPTYKPDAAFAFMKHWIDGKEYPRFDKSCIPHRGEKLTADVKKNNVVEHVALTSELETGTME